MKYALFKDGKQISKAYLSKNVVAIEAFERGATISWSADFSSDSDTITISDGYEIKEVSDD